GLNYNGGITYDCNGGFTENKTDPCEVYNLGPKYIHGTGWNGGGFPSFQEIDFVDNSTPRPDPLFGVRGGGGQYGTTGYNDMWNQLRGAINPHRLRHNWQGKVYSYDQNEPQNQADYDLAAYLANLSKSAAPNLRIAISEEPKPEIAENPMAMG